MKLKRLEIKGFKSFSDRTTLEFRPGITSVVGPNGCGKSNVLEAIRWVMGEQRARILRGHKMGDIIFNGSESRKPVGMAEVRMILANDNHCAHPSFTDYDEIMVTRRLYRDGESHYEINNIPCRLSDVTDLFLDTGVGRSSYSVVEQGRVEMVVASRPEDRRALIEEAAGINRYKVRKEAALKKLDQTTRNLERIKDVVAEVKRQSTALKRQAAAAERYRNLQNAVREMDLALHAGKCRDAQEQYGVAKSDLDRTTFALFEQERQCSSLEARLEAERMEAVELDRALKDLLQARHVTDISLTSVRASIQKDQDRLAYLAVRLDKLQDEKKELIEKVKKTELLRDNITVQKSTIQSQLKEADELLEKALAESKQAQERKHTHEKLVEDLKNELFQNLQETAQKRNLRENLKKRFHDLEANLLRITDEYDRVCEDLKEAHRSNRLLAETLEQASLQRKEFGKRKDELASIRKIASEQIRTLRDDLTNLEKELVGSKVRLESLEEMQRDFATYDQSVQFLMKDHDPTNDPALLVPLAELMDVPPKYQRALIAALGHRLGSLVVSSTAHGGEAAKRLKDSGQGRSTFVPVEPPLQPEVYGPVSIENSRPLKEIVQFHNGYENLGDFLLGGFWVVRDVDQALEIWSRNTLPVDLVTLDGDLLNRFGEIVGGSWDHYQDEIFSKRREVAALREDVQSKEKVVSEYSCVLSTHEEQVEKISAELAEIERLIDDLHQKETNIRTEQIHLEARISSGEKTKDLLKFETERLSKEKIGLDSETTRADGAIADLEHARKELETRMGDARALLQELDAVLVTKSHQNQETRVLAARLDEQYRSANRELSHTVANLQQMEASLSGLAQENARLVGDREKASKDLKEARDREKELMAEHGVQETSIERSKNESSSLGISLKAIEQERSLHAARAKDLRDKKHALEMETARLEQIVEGIVEKIIEHYHVDPRTVPCPDSSPDPQEIVELKAKLESMGEVNLAAIAESHQVNERLKFLQEQEQDLRKALASLFDTIDTINKSTSDLFLKAFDRINEKFQEIFPFLFGGGEAYLELTEEGNLLETGVDIVARPPGKRRQTMSLLSGGEKSLTAIALIFSIFLTRPSPFCLLDEVDAPLDDSNISRFTEMLKKLSDQTQFIVITHNKRTMEAADSLYGVTMEEPGASTVVSVQFAA